MRIGKKTCCFKIYVYSLNDSVSLKIKAAIVSNVATYNVVNREERNPNLYF